MNDLTLEPTGPDQPHAIVRQSLSGAYGVWLAPDRIGQYDHWHASFLLLSDAERYRDRLNLWQEARRE